MATLPNITPEAVERPAQVEEKKVKKNNFDSKNYLNVRLNIDKGEYEKELRIRILTVDAHTAEPFEEIVMHNVKVPKEVSASGWKNYVCLEQTKNIDHEHFGSKCPFCEMRRNAQAQMYKAKEVGDVEGEKRWKDIAKEYGSSNVAIIRCIERGKEDEGPKFWKFNIRLDKKDPMNQIKNLYDVRKKDSIESAKIANRGELPEGFTPMNILDLYKGKDLKVIIKAVFENGKVTNKTSVSIFDCGDPMPVSMDEQEMTSWVMDNKIWSDVFVVKPYDYLTVILNEQIPWFDRNTGTWVAKKEFKPSYDPETHVVTNEPIKNNTPADTSNDLPY